MSYPTRRNRPGVVPSASYSSRLAVGSYDLICLSLEPWDNVWRRNQLFATELLKMRLGLRLLFVEQPIDITWSLVHGRRPTFRPLRNVGESDRLWAWAPRKWLPRRVHPGVDSALGRQVLNAASRLRFREPVLWINDASYASWATTTGWPTVYDVTDDWLLARTSNDAGLKRHRRDDALLLRSAAQVVVCSPNLAQSRGRDRPVHLIPNGVDVHHFRHPRPRPEDLPAGPIVLYTGTLVEGRLDIKLCLEICRAVTNNATFVLVGPNSLSVESMRRLRQAGGVILGARPYRDLPAYMQHAAVLAVPHLVIPFTESLDPIKAREILAVGRPAVSTPS